MSPAPENTALRPEQKRRKLAKEAGLSTLLPWNDPKVGIAFRKRETCLGQDGIRFEREVIGSRLHEVLRRFGSNRLRANERGLKPGLEADTHAAQVAAMARGGKASESQPQYQLRAATFENFVEFMLDKTHDEKIRLRAVKAALQAGDTNFRVTEPTDLDAFMQFLMLMTAKWDKTYFADAEYGSVSVQARGGGYSTAKNYVSAMKHIDNKLTGKTNLGDERVIEFLAELERTSPAVNHAQEFDIAQVVPRWCDAIYEAEFDLRKVGGGD